MRQLLSVFCLALALLFTAPARAQFTGANNVTPTNCSGAITTGGTAQNAFANSGNLRGFIIQNLSSENMWISWTGTAAADTAGSFLLPAAGATTAGGSFVAPLGFGINTALSVVAATTGSKFSCTRY